jgi:hypothetical protein
MRSLQLYIFGTILLLCLGVFVGTRTSPSQNKEEPPGVTLINRTKFEVVKVKRENDRLVFSFKNNYERRITAFTLTVGQHYRISEDFVSNEVTDEFGIKPQDTVERSFPIPSTLWDDPIVNATLQAVIFDDKTGDGDPVVFEDMRDNRLGQAVQIKRSLKILEKYIQNGALNITKLSDELEVALSASDADTLNQLRELHPLGTINRKGKDPVSDRVKDGLHDAKADAQRRIDDAMRSVSPRDSLLDMKAHYEKLLKRL